MSLSPPLAWERAWEFPAGRQAARCAASKQFLELDGVPILIHTLRKFAACRRWDSWRLRKPEISGFAPVLERAALEKPVHLVVGGEHRQESVGNVLERRRPDDLVLIHDAVRPFVSEETIAEVIEQAQRHGAAIAGVPAVDTIKRVERPAEGALVEATIPREQMVHGADSQGFRYGLLRAFNEARIEASRAPTRPAWWSAPGTGRGGDGIAAEYQDHHPGRSGAGRVLPVAGAAPAGERDGIGLFAADARDQRG